MSQQQQHMEFTDLNRKFQESMTYNPQPYPMNGKMSTPAQMPTQMPPQMPPQMFSNIMPNMMPMPLMPMRSGVDMDYNRWMADSYQAAYRGVSAQQPQFGYEPVTQMQPLPKTHSANHLGKVNTSRSSSPMEDCNSPRFGPGPPIVTSEKVKGPRGCNLFVFHLPNEITNWLTP